MKRGKIRTYLAILLISIFLPAMADAAIYLTNSWARFQATAGETLSIGDVVCIKAADGKAYKAYTGDPNLRPAVGICSSGGIANNIVQVTTIGQFGGFTSLTRGTPVYLAGTYGGITQTPPSNYGQEVGTAISATTIHFNFGITYDVMNDKMDALAGMTISTSSPVTVSGTSGYFLNNTGTACEFDLPATATGKQFCFRNIAGATGALTVKIHSGQFIDMNGTNGTVGTLVSSGVLGDSACVVGQDSTHWLALPQRGVWTNN